MYKWGGLDRVRVAGVGLGPRPDRCAVSHWLSTTVSVKSSVWRTRRSSEPRRWRLGVASAPRNEWAATNDAEPINNHWSLGIIFLLKNRSVTYILPYWPES